MSVRFIFGGSGSGKSAHLYREIIRRSQREPDGKFFLIVPDQFSMQTQKDLVEMHERKGILNIDVLSFGRLTHRIFQELGGVDRPMLDDTGKSLIVRRVAALEKDRMPVIGGNLSRTGYVHEVKSAISEFMQYGIRGEDLEELTEFSKKRGQLCAKLKDLKVIYEGFLSFIRERFLTAEESLEVLADLLPSSSLMKGSVVAFDGFTGFTPVQNRVLRCLFSLASEVIFTVTLDGREDPHVQKGEQELFALSRRTVLSLEKLAREAGADRGEDCFLRPDPAPRFRQAPALAHLERHLFRYPAVPFDREPEEIRMFEASTQREEVRQICIAIRRLIREEGYCYRDIAVICGDFAAYASCLEQEFESYGIPVYLDQTRGIALNPFIEYLKSALSVRVQNYSYEAVFHYLRSGLADFSPEETDRLELYVRALGIRGKRKWETLFVYPADYMTDPRAELEELNALRSRLVEQMEPLYGRYRKMEEFAKGLYRFLSANRVQEKLVRFSRRFEEEGDLVRAREYAQIYRLVMDLLDQMVSLIGEEESCPEEFARILEAGFGEIQVGTIPLNVDRVVAGDMERTRLQQVKVLFFAGVNDGYIPKNAGKGGILSDLEREFLTGSGKELAPSPRQQMYIQRLYLYLNLTKPSRRLVLSCCRMDAQGRSMRPSYLIGQLTRLFPSLAVEQPERQPALSRIQTMADGREYLAAGLRAFADGAQDEEQRREFLILYRLYRGDENYAGWTKEMTEAAFYSYRERSLGKAVASALYGQTLLGSISRLEQYAACAYSHFLRYGLRLKEQEEYTFEAVDLGNIFHGVLEIFARSLEENGYTWFDFPEEEGERLVEEAVDAFAVGYHNTVLFDSARNAYMIERIKRILKRTVAAMQYQLKKGSFVPEQFEVSFSVLEELDAVSVALSEKEKMRLKGRIDRLDVREDERHVYVKVVDYKSGSRDFSLAALYYGLQLQLVVYLNAAMELTAKKHPHKEVVPAAMLYYRVQDPLVDPEAEEPAPEEIDRRILKALRTTGVVNARPEVVEGLDGEFSDRSDVVPVERKKDGSFTARSGVMEEADFKAVSEFVSRKIRRTGQRILEGRIALDPYVQGSSSACDYCPYRKVCGFDQRIGGYAMRELENLGEEEALSRIRKEVADGDAIYGEPAEGH